MGYITRKKYTRIRKHTKRRFIRKMKRINFNKPTIKDINVFGSYWGIIKHGDCRRLFIKYTKCRTIKDFKKKIKISVNK